MKKIISLLLVLVLALSLCACRKKDKEENQESGGNNSETGGNTDAPQNPFGNNEGIETPIIPLD